MALRTELESRLYTRHPELYFPDGNIAVKCITQDHLNSGSTVYFRLHQRVLEPYPDLFSALTTPTGDIQEFYDGIPMFESPENPKDLAIVLKFMYDEEKKPPFSSTDPDVAYTFASVLSLATRMNIAELSKLIFDRIRDDWPTDLAKWDARELYYYNSQQESPHLPIDFFAPEPASVIQIARAYPNELHTILPIVFYHLSRIPIDVTVYPLQKPASLSFKNERGVRGELLCESDRLKALAGRERVLVWLGEEFEKVKADVVWQQCPSGLKEQTCREIVEARLLVIQANILGDFDPLKILGNMFEGLGDDELCGRCCEEWKSRIGDVRSRLFESLEDRFLDLL